MGVLQNVFQKRSPDSEYFEYLYSKYYEKSFFYARQYVSDDELAREVTQDVFMTIWERRSKINEELSVQSLILTMTKNRCLNILRKRISEKKYSNALQTNQAEANLGALTDTTADRVISSEIEMLMNQSLEKLPIKIREVFLMSRQRDMSYQEIAQELDVSVKTVEYRMSRALAVLRKDLVDYIPTILLLFYTKFLG